VDSWLIIVITLVACSFFAGIEIAFVSANKLRIELENKNGVLSARIISFFLKHPGRFIVAMLLGSNIALVVYGIQMAELIEAPLYQFFTEQLDWHTNIGVLVIFLQTVFSTLLILIIAEFIPKALFRINPNGVLSIFAIPVAFFYGLLYPIVFVTMGIAEFILKRGFKIEFSEDKPVFGRIDLDNYVREHTSKIDSKEDIEHEIQIFQNALEFSEVKARDCMVPRTQIEGIDVSEPIEELHKKFIDTGLSKMLIYQESIDHIIGYAHSFAMFNSPKTIRSVLMPIIIIPETLAANQLLTRFIQERKSLAVVVDEFGGTSGIITMEDVMEEIFGEISDEHDVEEFTDKQLSPTEFIFSGHIKVDYLNDKYKLKIGEGENYETLAGFILNHHEDIPHLDEEITIGDFKFIITRVLGNKIEEVKLTINTDE
jgi:CBS domain containing-hemolysin-like protein